MLRAFLPAVVLSATLGVAAPVSPQTPAPFPRPGATGRGAPQPPTAKPAAPPPAAPAQTTPAARPPTTGAPDERLLGVPIYAGAEFIVSYDAGRNQRYYLFGSSASFAEIVAYYRTALKQRGELVYEEPTAIHEFDVGRFREETMAFPPGVTVKDYASGGSAGYLNPKRGATPARFRTVIQIVPVVPE